MSMSHGVKLDSTRSGTRYLPANSTERICSTFEPRLAISSISSKLTVVQAARVGDDARVGGVDAVDVGVDQALGGLQRRGDRHRRGVRAAAAERGDVAVGIDALEAGDDDDLAGGEIGADARIVDALDARLGVGDVGRDRHLPAGVADRGDAFGLQRDARAGRPRPARRSPRSCRARAAPARSSSRATPAWRAPAGGWSRRSSPRGRRPSGARPAPTWRRGARRCWMRSGEPIDVPPYL